MTVSKIQKVEIVRVIPPFWFALILALFGLAFRTLIVWWAVSEFFPQFGLSYGALLLPVFALRVLLGDATEYRRSFQIKNLSLGNCIGS